MCTASTSPKPRALSRLAATRARRRAAEHPDADHGGVDLPRLRDRARRRGRGARRARRRQRAQALGRLSPARGRADLRDRRGRARCGTPSSAAPRPAGLHQFPGFEGRPHVAPATPGDLLFHIRAHRLDLCFELAERLVNRLRGSAPGRRRGARLPLVRRARPARVRRRHREPRGRGGRGRRPHRRRGRRRSPAAATSWSRSTCTTSRPGTRCRSSSRRRRSGARSSATSSSPTRTRRPTRTWP